MKILILGLNYAPEEVGVGLYTTGLAEGLVGRGHTVSVIAAPPFYPKWVVSAGYSHWRITTRTENGVRVTRVPVYVPAKPNGARRLLHHASFAFFSLFATLWRALVWRPDLVIAIAPSLMSAPVARLATGLCGARSWLHVQDFEVEAAMAMGLVASGADHWALRLERWILGGFDRVSSISAPMCSRLIEKGVLPEKVRLIRNWAETDLVRPLAEPSDLRQEWGISAPHVALYSGSIGNKQGLETVIEAARLLQHRTDLIFVICSEGPSHGAIKAQAAGLPNVMFRSLLPKAQLGQLLGLASVHLLPQRREAAKLMLPSKLVNMLASGQPVVAMAEPGTALADEVAGCGLIVPHGDAGEFAMAVQRLIDNRHLAASFGAAGRRRAESVLNPRSILANFDAEVQDLCSDVEPVGAPAE